MARVPACAIVPVFNDAPYIAQCLLSLSRQTYPPEEIILVDNASTDGSAQVAEGLGLPNLRIIRNSSNFGASAARTMAFEATRQPYIVFLDSDDFLSPDALGSAFQQIDEHSMCLFRLVLTQGDGVSIIVEKDAPAAPINGMEALNRSVPHWHVHAHGLFRREVLTRARGAFTPHGHADDEVLFRLMLAEAETVTGCTGTYFYRMTDRRPVTFARVLGQTRANIRSAKLAQDRLGTGFSYAKDARDIIARNLIGLLVRATRGQGNIDEVFRLYAETRSLQSTGGSRARLTNAMLRIGSACHRAIRRRA